MRCVSALSLAHFFSLMQGNNSKGHLAWLSLFLLGQCIRDWGSLPNILVGLKKVLQNSFSYILLKRAWLCDWSRRWYVCIVY